MRGHRIRSAVCIAVVLGCLGLPAVAPADPPAGLQELVGALHEHSAYSDGWPGTRPADVFASGKGYGLDFLGSADHSDNLGIPLVFNEACYGEGRGGEGEIHLPECLMADQKNPADSFRKWEATEEQRAAATSETFAGIRGFEWSSDRFGHLDVFFSKNYTSAYTDGGLADLDTFWSWFTRAPTLGGGSDGLGTFNHPSAKKVDIPETGESAPGRNWDDFRYVPAADERMVGLEVFNDRREYGSRDDYPEGAYAHALDKGWHLGAIGAEDLGHRKPPLDNWGGPEWPKTVIQASERTPEAIRAALLARRFYAVGWDENELRLEFTVDGRPMGSRLQRPVDEPLKIKASVNDADVKLEAVTSGGQVVDSAAGALDFTRAAARGERYFFIRARRGERPVAYSSPIWVRAGASPEEGSWLAGDLHVHSCYSHDSYCGPGDDSSPEEFYSTASTIAERFTEAAAKGLDFLTISDHDDIRAHSDPDFGSQGVLGLRAYEASLAGGHAQLLGATRKYDKGTGGTPVEAAPSINGLADALNADGGAFQANHPSYRGNSDFTECGQAELANFGASPLHWKFGFDVRPDSIEVWNTTALIPPAELYWECWLQRGWHIGATGGSDSHGGNHVNLGSPATWVFSRSNRESAILDAIREGRTTQSRQTPSQGEMRLLLEADGDGDGSYEAMIGDIVKPGVKMRVRADGLSSPGDVRVRANGATIVDAARLAPGATVNFTAPDQPGWVRATLTQSGAQVSGGNDPNCRPGSPSPFDLCSTDTALMGMTSPIYLERPTDPNPGPVEETPPKPDPEPKPNDTPAPPAQDHEDEPDDQPPIPAGAQGGAEPLPTVPSQSNAGEQRRLGNPLRRVVVRVRRLATRSARFRFQVRWRPGIYRYDVQVRRPGRRGFRYLMLNRRETTLVFRGRLPGGYVFRVRARRADGRVGPWRRSAPVRR